MSGLPGRVAISLPMMDVTEITKEPLYRLARSNKNISIMANKVGTEAPRCRFIHERCTFVRWDGFVSPCMGLIHGNTTYLRANHTERRVESYTLGDIRKEGLGRIWRSDEYRSFRDKVDAFDFSPCASCGGCNYSETNKEDCVGSTFPTCGGCLWAQGIIQCP